MSAKEKRQISSILENIAFSNMVLTISPNYFITAALCGNEHATSKALCMITIWLLQWNYDVWRTRLQHMHTDEIWEAEDIWPGKRFNLQLKNSDVWSGLSCLLLYGSHEKLSARHLVFCFLTRQTGISSPAFVLYITLLVCQQISVGC